MKRLRLSTVATLAAAVLALAGAGAHGAAVDPAGCLANDLGRGDDISSAAVPLPFPVTFFGTTYSSLYVNNNGNVTFDAPLADYTPAGMPNLHRPLIAPFFADVDTRNPASGTVHWGETAVGSAKAFCVLWDGVGYYNTHASKSNRFQLLLVERPDQAAGDFDLVLNYDRIQWETGDADSGVDGLGGLAAEVGFTNADQHFSMLGSQQSGAFLDTNPDGLVYGSFNAGDVTGRYVFRVRAGNPGLGQPLSGTVRAADGTIVPDTLLRLCPLGGGGEACLTTNTRPDGSYTFIDVLDGTWGLVGFPPASTGGAAGALTGIQVAGRALTGIDLALPDAPPAPGALNGSVQTTGGDAIADATITVLAAPTPAGPFLPVADGSTLLAPGQRGNPTLTDANGAFAFDALAGFYRVQAQKNGCFAARQPATAYAESPLLTLPPAPSALVLKLECPAAPTDTTPPVIEVPAPITAEASSADGAAVSYTVSATDDVDGPVPVACTPASGSTFALGTNEVSCQATDAAGNVGTASFTITVADTTPPTVQVPGTTTAEATSPAGTAVSFGVSAGDAVDGQVQVSCDHESGSTFPVGATTVHCRATDTHRNTGTADFAVVVTDTTAPTLDVPATITAEATSAAGAAVSYTVSASDLVDGPLTASCAPASGSTFALGTTNVHCTVADAHGNGASAQFDVVARDTTAPSLQVPATVSVPASSAAGALVSFSVSALDAVDGPVPVTCDHASGSSFPVGTTIVHCSTEDAAGNRTAAQFDVVVTPPDTSAPVLDLPAAILVNASVPGGAVVSYTVSAVDVHDGTVPVVCSWASGSLFPIGTTVVTCTASDTAGNEASGSFTVHVNGAREQLEALLAEVMTQNLGPGSSLEAKLRDALASLEPLAPGSTCLILTNTENLAAAQAGKKLTVAQADWLRSELARMKRVLGC